jgi:hypothetical protein
MLGFQLKNTAIYSIVNPHLAMCISQSQQGPNSRTQIINIQVCGTASHSLCNSGGMQPLVCAIPGIVASVKNQPLSTTNKNNNLSSKPQASKACVAS